MKKPNSKTNQYNSSPNPHQSLSPSHSVVSPDMDTNESQSHGNNFATKNKPPRTGIKDWIMVLATIVIAVATTVYTVIAHKQWSVMSRTLEEMQNSGKESTTQINSMINETNRIADSMKETVAQSKKALDATIDNFHLEQRAWIGITEVYPPEYSDGDKKVYLKEGQKIKPEIILINSGKTLAKKVRPLSLVQFMKRNIDPFANNKIITNTLKIHQNVQSNDVMQPGIRTHIFPPTIPTDAIVTKANIDDIKHERYCLYIIGLVTYEDVFGKSHLTKFCMSLDPNLTHWSPCHNNNDSD